MVGLEGCHAGLGEAIHVVQTLPLRKEDRRHGEDQVKLTS